LFDKKVTETCRLFSYARVWLSVVVHESGVPFPARAARQAAEHIQLCMRGFLLSTCVLLVHLHAIYMPPTSLLVGGSAPRERQAEAL
jgi:hypothetical protein